MSLAAVARVDGNRRRERHGKRQSAEYRIWRAIRSRCYDSSQDNYVYYGARGIRVCRRWLNSFLAFFKDMGARPSASYTIERKRNDRNYSPSNCFWASWDVQARNRRSTKWIIFRGVRMSLIEACTRAKLPYPRIAKRLQRGWLLSEAFGRTDVSEP